MHGIVPACVSGPGGAVQLPRGCVWELEVRPQAASAWRPLGAQQELKGVCADGLLPGTKYVFRARAGGGAIRCHRASRVKNLGHSFLPAIDRKADVSQC